MSYPGDSVRTRPAEGLHLDAFGRSRVSQPNMLIDSTMLEDSLPMMWAQKTVTGGAIAAHSPNRASVILSVDGTSGGRAVRQTRRYTRYRAGQSQFVACTFVVATASPSPTIAVVRRSKVTGSVVDERHDQETWDDPLDGTGRSGITMDWSLAQILLTDIQWLGVGQVRVAFEVGGVAVPVIGLAHSNVLSSVYMSRARLPVRYEVVESAGTTYVRVGYFDDDNGIFLEYRYTGAVPAQIEQICSTVLREGGAEEPSHANCIHLTAAQTVTTTFSSVIAIRLRAAHIRRMLHTFQFEGLNVGATNPMRWQPILIRAAAIPAGLTTWVDAGTASFPSAAEYCVDHVSLAAITDFRQLPGGYLPASAAGRGGVSVSNPKDDLSRVLADVDGASDALVIGANTDASTSDLRAMLSWRED